MFGNSRAPLDVLERLRSKPLGTGCISNKAIIRGILLIAELLPTEESRRKLTKTHTAKTPRILPLKSRTLLEKCMRDRKMEREGGREREERERLQSN